MLTLPIKRQWFEMIKDRVKLEEYRDITPYYTSRFSNIFEMFPYSKIPTGLDKQRILLRNGYSSTSPTIEIVCTLDVGMGREEWGAEPGKIYYILKISQVRSI
jgi:hypothetical protein